MVVSRAVFSGTSKYVALTSMFARVLLKPLSMGARKVHDVEVPVKICKQQRDENPARDGTRYNPVKESLCSYKVMWRSLTHAVYASCSPALGFAECKRAH